MDARARGEQVDSGEIGPRPVGSTRSTVMASLDYQVPWLRDLSLDLALEGSGRRVANPGNTHDVPAATLVDLGARYRVRMRDIHGTLRIRATNLFDAYTWDVAGSGPFSYNAPRELIVRVTIDF